MQQPTKSKGWKKFFIAAAILSSSLAAQADHVKLLANDIEAMQARIDLISRAGSEIQTEYFSVWNDEQSVAGFSLLLDAARRGVKVKVIVDAMSNSIPKSMITAMRQKSIGPDGQENFEIKFYNPFSLVHPFRATHRDHAKMLIVDGKSLIIGGRNVGDKYFGKNKKRNFTDTDVLLEGKTASDAKENFMRVWNSSLAQDPALGSYAQNLLDVKDCLAFSNRGNGRQECESQRERINKEIKEQSERTEGILKKIMTIEDDDDVVMDSGRNWFESSEDLTVKFMSQEPDQLISEGNNHLSQDLKALVLTAAPGKDLNIMSPYLIPTKETYQLFATLLQKGVNIRVVTNSLRSTDNLFAQAGYMSAKKKLIKMGVEIWEYNGPDTAHAKIAVMENEENKVALVGTFNLDPRSIRINREVAVAVFGGHDSQFVQELTDRINWFRGTKEDGSERATLVGKNGIEFNKEKWAENDKEVSAVKRGLLKILLFLSPLFKDQV